MAANINDKITKTFDTVNPNVAKVTADRAPGSTTLQANNLAGWTEVTAEHFSTYRVDAQNKLIEGSQTDWKGIVNKATNTITNLTRVGGAEDSGSLVNDIIQAGPTAKWADDLADGILVTHNADGTLKNNVVSTAKIGDNQVTTAKIADSSVTADKLDSASFGTVDANDWRDFGTYFVKSVTITNTTDLAQFATTNINLSSNFGAPVKGVAPSVSNTTLTDRFIVDSSWSTNCIGYAGATVFSMVYVNARNGNSKIGTRRVTAVVYGRQP